MAFSAHSDHNLDGFESCLTDRRLDWPSMSDDGTNCCRPEFIHFEH